MVNVMTSKKVSVIVPAYNAQETIKECIDSLINQKISVNIIIVNDGSTDKTSKILKEYKDSKNIFVIETKHIGVSNARNVAIKLVKTDYVTFVDADDIVTEYYVDNLLKEITYFKADLSICGYSLDNHPVNLKQHDNYTSEEFVKDIITPGNCGGYVWNKLFRLDIIREHSIYFDSHIQFGEDLLFCAKYGKFCSKIVVGNSVDYIKGSDGVSSIYKFNTSFSYKIFDLLKVYDRLKSLYADNKTIIREVCGRQCVLAADISRMLMFQDKKSKTLKGIMYSNLISVIKSRKLKLREKVKPFLVLSFPVIQHWVDVNKLR